jgi:hypothetical protein
MGLLKISIYEFCKFISLSLFHMNFNWAAYCKVLALDEIFQGNVTSFHKRLFQPCFSGFNGWKSNCHFWFFLLFLLQLLIPSFKWRVWVHFWYLCFKNFQWNKRISSRTRFTPYIFVPKNSKHFETLNFQSGSSFWESWKCFFFISWMGLRLFLVLTYSLFIYLYFALTLIMNPRVGSWN